MWRHIYKILVCVCVISSTVQCTTQKSAQGPHECTCIYSYQLIDHDAYSLSIHLLGHSSIHSHIPIHSPIRRVKLIITLHDLLKKFWIVLMVKWRITTESAKGDWQKNNAAYSATL